MDPAETESYCREQHRMFVESMERYMLSNREGSEAGHPSPGAPSAASPDSPSAPWGRMAADLGWSVEQVQIHAYLYYAALCDDRRARKRKRRMERQNHNDGNNNASEGQDQPQSPSQEKQSRIAAGGDAETAPAEKHSKPEAGLVPPSEPSTI